jgi:Tfp pilus assembly protein PilO
MSQLPKEKRDKMILVAICFTGVLAGLWYGPIRYQKAALVAKKDKIIQTENRVANSQRLVSQAAKHEAEYLAASARLKTLEEAMVTGDMYSWIIRTINRLQTPYKIEIPNFSPPAVGELKSLSRFPYQAATFAIRGTGYYHELGKFVADFENSFPTVTVQNLDIEPLGILAASPEDQEKISFKMEIVALVKPKTSL